MFSIGQTYQRPELLQFIGSKQLQSGILWNKEGSDMIIVTSGGRHGKNASYHDHRNYDGTWVYYGQGSTGDQNPYSAANSLLTNQNKKVLLFTTREVTSKEARERKSHSKLYKFEGVFTVASWSEEIAIDGKRAGDKLVKYILAPLIENLNEDLPLTDPLQDVVLEPRAFYGLRNKVKVKSPLPPTSKIFTSEYYERSTEIKEYALLRANGKCENCENDAPFVNSKDIPFLEVHHIFSLSDKGPDIPLNVAAICPNCHKEAHYGKNMDALKSFLSNKIKEKEKDLDDQTPPFGNT